MGMAKNTAADMPATASRTRNPRRQAFALLTTLRWRSGPKRLSPRFARVAGRPRRQAAWRLGLVWLLLAGIGAGVCAGAGGGGAAYAAESAVVFMYHRFGETTFPSTNIRIDQFEAQIAELTDGNYTVKSLPEIVARLRAGQSLPDRTVGISIDDAYISTYTEAWPRLREAKLPFTLFVATDPVDQGIKGYMNWDQLRELARDGVTIGSQTASHLHMAASSPARNARDVAKSNRRFQAELGMVPKMIAYPFGEYSLAVGKVVRVADFTTAFGQHSGVLHRRSDFFFLPRFAMNETYGSLDRLRLAANALPLAVADLTPSDAILGPETNPPAFGFTVLGKSGRDTGRLACYASGQGRAKIERLGKRRIEVRLEQPFPPGRGRINCTAQTREGRWRWFGMQFYIPRN
jgi:peptidoglycan/xylan/chitin deacetylase (PgdA/CDA1 family)